MQRQDLHLTEVFRQAAESRIIVNAHRINHGLMPDLDTADSGDFYFVDAADAEEGVRKLLAIVQQRIPKRFGLNPIRDIQVLCPMKRGGLGARYQPQTYRERWQAYPRTIKTPPAPT